MSMLALSYTLHMHAGVTSKLSGEASVVTLGPFFWQRREHARVFKDGTLYVN